jgi:hypothetical protein
MGEAGTLMNDNHLVLSVPRQYNCFAQSSPAFLFVNVKRANNRLRIFLDLCAVVGSAFIIRFSQPSLPSKQHTE